MKHDRLIPVARVGSSAIVVAAMAFAVTGCSGLQNPTPTAGSGAAKPAGSMPAASTAAKKMSMASDANFQGCAACMTGKEPTLTVGAVETVNGVQVARVTIINGYYSPNEFAASAGMPIQVAFRVDGRSAKACVSKPTFKSLNKTITITAGEKALDLGTLTAGTYEFSCAMGSNRGHIVVK